MNIRRIPLGLRLKVIAVRITGYRNREKRMKLMRELSRRRHFTIPRQEIHWYPAIDKDKCSGCKVCLEFCPKSVFILSKDKKKVEVQNPFSCVVLCSRCVKKCPAGAISFPNRKDFQKYVYYE